MQNKLKSRTLKIVITAVMTALTTIVTAYVSIPNGVDGNINIGDSVIFVSAVLLGPLSATFVGGIGSMIADLISGYASFAPFTLIVKGLEGLVAGLIAYYAFNLETKNKVSGIIRVLLTIGGIVISALVMIFGYFVTSLILNNGMVKTALIESGGNLIQGAISVGVATVLVFVTRIDIIAKRYLYVYSNANVKNNNIDKSDNKSDEDNSKNI